VIVPAVTSIAVFSVGGVAIAHAVSDDPSHDAAGGAGVVVAHSNDNTLVPSVPILPPPSPAPRLAAAHHQLHSKAHHVPPALRIVDVHGPCYVEVSRRGKLVTRTIIRQGRQLTFRQHGLHVVLGNAGAVRLHINGHPAVRGGRTGQVRIIHVN
jgi:hypothetical protein